MLSQVDDELADIDLTDPELNKAATKIQASFRGHKVTYIYNTNYVKVYNLVYLLIIMLFKHCDKQARIKSLNFLYIIFLENTVHIFI